jgi:hypothetical protein
VFTWWVGNPHGQEDDLAGGVEHILTVLADEICRSLVKMIDIVGV